MAATYRCFHSSTDKGKTEEELDRLGDFVDEQSRRIRERRGTPLVKHSPREGAAPAPQSSTLSKKHFPAGLTTAQSDYGTARLWHGRGEEYGKQQQPNRAAFSRDCALLCVRVRNHRGRGPRDSVPGRLSLVAACQIRCNRARAQVIRGRGRQDLSVLRQPTGSRGISRGEIPERFRNRSRDSARHRGRGRVERRPQRGRAKRAGRHVEG